MTEKRFSIHEPTGLIFDSATLKYYSFNDVDEIIDLLNTESERADRNAELCTDDGLIKLEWQRSIYKNFADKVIRIMDKHEIDNLDKLDKILVEQRVW